MNNGKWMDLDWTLELEMDGFRLDFRVGDGWIQTGLQSWRWMDLDWSLDLSLDWIQTEIGQDIPVILVKIFQ